MNALSAAQHFAEELQRFEFRGMGDTRDAARLRVSRRTGVPESYLKRLRYKLAEMRDVSGDVLWRLQRAYEAECEKHEAAARAMRAERLGITDATVESADLAVRGMGSQAPARR